MRWSDVQFDPPAKVLRQFAALCLIVLGGLAVWRAYARGEWGAAAALGASGLAVGLAGWFRPGAVRPIYVASTVATFPVSWLASWVVSGAVYYGLFAPLAVLFRLTGRDLLRRRSPAVSGSYWEPKPAPSDPGRYLRQY
jgi:hypothetical protein